MNSYSSKRFIIILGVIAFILLIPFLSMQWTDEVQWSGFDFLIAGILLLSAGLALEFILRRIKRTQLRILFISLLAIGLLLLWAELAVGIFNSPLAGN